jgi:hypothetical protein
MKHMKLVIGLVLSAGFVAATLQGSRLPDETVHAGQQLARTGAPVENRSGSGSDKEEYPPRSESVFA